jgi:hypothetical protein
MSESNIPIHISNVSNKLYFVCSYCSKVSDTINILNKCNICSNSFCTSCLEENDNKFICKICDSHTHKVKCSNCGKNADDKICCLCSSTICENCSNDVDCICKDGIKCNNCKPKKNKTCEFCDNIICSDKCSKKKCFVCNKGCGSCLIVCGTCKKSRCFSCDESHHLLPCNECKIIPKQDINMKCNLCSICSNSCCKNCLITCTCCLITSCNTCYKNHKANSDECKSCNKLLCCNECVNIDHDSIDCPLCDSDVLCKKNYVMSCNDPQCNKLTYIILCCNCDIKNIKHDDDPFNEDDDFKITQCCDKTYCDTHYEIHKC